MSSDNPTVFSGSNPNFPFDPIASMVLNRMPDGLVAGTDVLDQFLDPPPLRGEWFTADAWQQTSNMLRIDDGISLEEYNDAIDSFTAIQDNLQNWTKLRPDMGTDGYAATLPDDMRSAGNEAWTAIRSLTAAFSTYCDRSNVGDDSKTAMKNMTYVLMEYGQCMAFELEASHDQIDVAQIHQRYNDGETSPWEPGLTPENIGNAGITIGGERMPELPKLPPETTTFTEPEDPDPSDPGPDGPDGK